MLAEIPKATEVKGNQYSGKWNNDTAYENPKPKTEVVKELGFTQKQAERIQTMAKHPEVVKGCSLNRHPIFNRGCEFNSYPWWAPAYKNVWGCRAGL